MKHVTPEASDAPRRLRANGPHAFDAVTAVGIAQAWKRPGTYLLEVTDPWG